MKIFVTNFSILICLFSVVFLFKTDIPNKNIIPIQQLPQFPGGEDSLWCFLESHLQYDIINSDSVSVTYRFRFYIDTLGQASNFGLLGTKPKDLITKHDSLKKAEIVRVLKLLPRWKFPHNDLPKYGVWYSIPITTPLKDFKCQRLKLTMLNLK
jgi:hypothetical protein